jgi:hypothetical protein
MTMLWTTLGSRKADIIKDFCVFWCHKSVETTI